MKFTRKGKRFYICLESSYSFIFFFLQILLLHESWPANFSLSLNLCSSLSFRVCVLTIGIMARKRKEEGEREKKGYVGA
jgi:hypothetical protein